MHRVALLTGSVALAAATALAQPAAAEPAPANNPPRLPCHDYVKMAQHLGTKYAEKPVAFGMQSNGNLLQVFASPDTGTWTILSVSPKGTSCILAAGKSWEDMPKLKDDPFA
ncbi:MAG TPA: hypothetical protein VFG47_06365 [Geminicoccaceae bacterium]|nr:hypothetical protein [Geminicoccaceae bacterium]